MTNGVTTPGGPVKRQVRADVDRHSAGVHEHVQQGLRQAHIDLSDGHRKLPLATVGARVVDVDVEPVLVGGVADPATHFGAEVAAVAQAQIADPHPWRVRVPAGELAQDPQRRPHQVVGAPPTPVAVRPAVQDRVPGEEVIPAAGNRTPCSRLPAARGAELRWSRASRPAGVPARWAGGRREEPRTGCREE